MRLIKPSFEIWDQQSGLEGIYKQIERVGRVCYKSEDKITEDSAKPFVERMVKSGHGAMLEHGTVYLQLLWSEDGQKEFEDLKARYTTNQYSKIFEIHTYPHSLYITTNYRVLVENGWLDDLKYLCEPAEHHAKRITVHFVCDRGVSHEFVRHRVFSFAQESTRYCNYSKDKFGNEVTFIQPCWDYIKTAIYNGVDNFNGDYFEHSLREAEMYYFKLLEKWEDKVPDKRYKSGFRDNPWTPQQARAVLPNALKTELVMTGFVEDWKHFFFLRCPVNAHPQARELAIPLSEEFVKRGYINSKNFE